MSLIEQVKVIPRVLLSDDRGWFLKVMTGKEENLPAYTGEVYLTCATAFQVKGGHYHPIALEWFTLIKGRCDLYLEDIFTKEVRLVQLSESDPNTIFIPNNVAHLLVNTQKEEFILLSYTDQLFDPKDTINYEIKY
jgi:dTDP-4-dehydrorhamnose 3,5-epimerase-like enzyme